MQCDFSVFLNCFFSYSSVGKSESSQATSTGVSASSVGASAAAGTSPEGGAGTQKTPPPGLSENGLKRVLGENPPGVDDLEKVGLTFIRLLHDL